jgi:hypothetical protein
MCLYSSTTKDMQKQQQLQHKKKTHIVIIYKYALDRSIRIELFPFNPSELQFSRIIKCILNDEISINDMLLHSI